MGCLLQSLALGLLPSRRLALEREKKPCVRGKRDMGKSRLHVGVTGGGGGRRRGVAVFSLS